MLLVSSLQVGAGEALLELAETRVLGDELLEERDQLGDASLLGVDHRQLTPVEHTGVWLAALVAELERGVSQLLGPLGVTKTNDSVAWLNAVCHRSAGSRSCSLSWLIIAR